MLSDSRAAVAEADSLFSAGRLRRAAHVLEGVLPQLCDWSTEWFASQLDAELYSIANPNRTGAFADRYVKERVADALSYAAFRLQEQMATNPVAAAEPAAAAEPVAGAKQGLAAELYMYLHGLDFDTVMGDPAHLHYERVRKLVDREVAPPSAEPGRAQT